VTARSRHVGVAEHSRDLLYPRLALCDLHIARRNATLLSLGHDQVLIGVHSDLWQVRDDERLPALARHIHQRFSDSAADLAADALIDFIEHECRHDVVRCEHHLQRQHET